MQSSEDPAQGEHVVRARSAFVADCKAHDHVGGVAGSLFDLLALLNAPLPEHVGDLACCIAVGKANAVTAMDSSARSNAVYVELVKQYSVQLGTLERAVCSLSEAMNTATRAVADIISHPPTWTVAPIYLAGMRVLTSTCSVSDDADEFPALEPVASPTGPQVASSAPSAPAAKAEEPLTSPTGPQVAAGSGLPTRQAAPTPDGAQTTATSPARTPGRRAKKQADQAGPSKGDAKPKPTSKFRIATGIVGVQAQLESVYAACTQQIEKMAKEYAYILSYTRAWGCLAMETFKELQGVMNAARTVHENLK